MGCSSQLSTVGQGQAVGSVHGTVFSQAASQSTHTRDVSRSFQHVSVHPCTANPLISILWSTKSKARGS